MPAKACTPFGLYRHDQRNRSSAVRSEENKEVLHAKVREARK